SPEQAKGRPADKRSDVWAFGCVLYEMLTGRRAFEGEDLTDTIVSVMSKEPEWKALPPGTPTDIQTLLRRCLHKDSQKRLPYIGVARLEIDESMVGPTASVRAPAVAMPSRSRSRWIRAAPWALGAAVLGAAALALLGLRRDGSSSRLVTRLELNLPAGVELFRVIGPTIAVSP